jgi:2-succinyl-6-hydroxy-2,4-cyclohexadiene-1-carboxylate synthase
MCDSDAVEPGPKASPGDVQAMLGAEVRGRGPRLALVHGFAQNRRCWGPVADDLSDDHELVLVDAPGHGASSGYFAGLRTGARLIADQGGTATYLGYSMGGRFVLHLALANPQLVRGLVLVGATAGIEDPAERAARAERDELLAQRLEAEGLEAFLAEWLAQPLFVGLDEAVQFRHERLDNTVDGLANSLRQAGTGTQDPLWGRLGRIEVPVLVVAGGDDEKFSAEARRIVDAIGPNATLAIVSGAGHAAHLERPDEFLAALRPWLTAHSL